jgi:2'-5' RNA ligase
MATRTFVALDIDEEIRVRLAEVRAKLDDAGSKIAWVAPENMHLTLSFLGDVRDELLAKVCGLASEAAAKVAPFEFHLRGVRCVPPKGGQLKMFWADVEDPTGRLVELHATLEEALSALELRQENRQFKGHITLARIRSARDPQALRGAAEALSTEDFGTQHAEELVTYSSELTPDGPIYAPLARARLGGR